MQYAAKSQGKCGSDFRTFIKQVEQKYFYYYYLLPTSLLRCCIFFWLLTISHIVSHQQQQIEQRDRQVVCSKYCLLGTAYLVLPTMYFYLLLLTYYMHVPTFLLHCIVCFCFHVVGTQYISSSGQQAQQPVLTQQMKSRYTEMQDLLLINS